MSLYGDIHAIKGNSDKISQGQVVALGTVKELVEAVVALAGAVASLTEIVKPMAADLKSVADGLKDEVAGIVINPGDPESQ